MTPVSSATITLLTAFPPGLLLSPHALDVALS